MPRHSTPEANRRHSLRKYGLTPEEYDLWLESQNGRCALCDRLPSKRRRLAVDHDHKTHAIRGLLCGRCNVGLGLLGDSIKHLREAINYLMAAK